MVTPSVRARLGTGTTLEPQIQVKQRRGLRDTVELTPLRYGLIWMLCAWIGVIKVAVGSDTNSKPLSIDDLAGAAELRYAPISISSDGHYVAFTVNRPTERRARAEQEDPFFLENGTPREADGDEVRVTDLKTGISLTPGGDVGASWGGIWSPDGLSLAFFSNRDGVVRLWLWNSSNNTIRRISKAETKAEIEWRQLWWSADGKKLLVRLVSEGKAHASSLATKDLTLEPGISVFRSARLDNKAETPVTEGGSDWQRGDLALIDVSTGNIQRLVRDVPIFGYWLSPVGDSVVYTVLKPGPIAESDSYLDLMLIASIGGQPRLLAANIQQVMGNTVSWSPDGTAIAYGSGTRTQIFDLRGHDQYYVVHSTGGRPILVTPGEHPPFEARVNQGPLWSKDSRSLYLIGGDALWRADAKGGGLTSVGALPGRALRTVIGTGAAADRLWSPDNGKSARVITFDPNTMAMGFARVDLHGGPTTALFEESASLGAAANGFFSSLIAASGAKIVYARETAHEVQDMWIADPKFAGRHRLTHINPVLDRYTFGKSRLTEWARADGRVLRGALLLPSSYQDGHRYPLVVEVYGGANLSKNLNTFGAAYGVANGQLLATRGYAMLMPDAPLDDTSPMRDIALDVLPGLDKAIELGIADPDRLAITGHSYGGYSVLAMITQTRRFEAAIDVSGSASNLLTEYGAIRKDSGISTGIAWSETGQGRMGGTPWERRDRFIANSPFFFLDRVSTPLLIIYATGDQSVPWYAGDELFSAMRRLGEEVEYVRYEGEDHSPMEWSLEHRKDYYTRIVSWLERFLKAS